MKITKILLLVAPMFVCAYVHAEPPKILVAYYSLTGKTEQVAKAIAKASGGQLYRIEVAKSYPDDTKERRAILEQEIDDNYHCQFPFWIQLLLLVGLHMLRLCDNS